jgi:PAS domain S-box-containing protein
MQAILVSILRSRGAGYLSAVLGIAAVITICSPLRDQLSNTTVALALLLVVLFVATGWARGPGMVASVLGMLGFNFFFLPPVYTLTIADPQNWVALAAFIITASTVGHLSVTAKRRAAEAEAGRKAARLASSYNRSLIEASLDPLVTIGHDGKITDVNAATETVTGYARAELIGTDFSDYFTEPEKARLGYQQAFREGLVRDYTLEVRHRDGHTIPILYNASVYRDETGQVVGVFAAARDITERKRAESEIRLLAHLQSVVAELGQRALRSDRYENVLAEAVTRVAQTLDVEHCNIMELLPGGEEFLLRAGVGWKEGSVGRTTVPTKGSQPGYTISSDRPVIVDDAATETRFVPLPRLFGENVLSAMSVVISTREGPYGALGAHTPRRRTFTTDEVNFLQAVANVLGATIERRRAEAALRESEANLNRAQEIAHIGSWYLDVTHNRLSWSDEVFRIFGVPRGTALTYEAFLDAIHGDDRAFVDKAWTAALHGAPYDIEHRIVVGGELKWVRERAKVEFDQDGKAVYGIGTVQDITQRKRAEEEIRMLNAELEQRVIARTAELQAANKLKDQLLVREQAASAELAAAREREIKIGFKIQQMLLLDQPPRDVPGLRVAALTVPSERIDGDFYDFFKHDNQCLDVIVADVMGKGVPAALLGAATKSHFIEALCHLMAMSRTGRLPEPQEIVTLAHTNMVRHLIALESFVTLCYARLDLNRRSLDLVDCGHTGIIHWRARPGLYEMLHGDNLPLGIREGEIYDQISIPFEPEDLLLFFSDGISEARSAAGELFGVERLVDYVRINRDLEPEALVDAIRKAVIAFSESEQLTDDLTCVAIKVEGRLLPLGHAEIEIRSDLKELRRAREFVRAVCRDLPGAPLDADSVAAFELAVNEAASNIMKHAYHGRVDQWIHLEAEVFPGQVSIRLHHLGDPFNPSTAAPPAFDGSQESGFGVYLITQSVDDVRYYRDERGRNCIALVKVCKS